MRRAVIGRVARSQDAKEKRMAKGNASRRKETKKPKKAKAAKGKK
jgi:hypothetical protein